MDVTKIFGPPGTGKTTRLLEIMERELAAGIPPERLAYLTFTVAARREAKQRAVERFGFTYEQLTWFRTLHSAAYRVLGINERQMLSADDLQNFAREYGYRISTSTGNYNDDGIITTGFEDGDRFISFDHLCRHRVEDPVTAMRAWDEDRYSSHDVRRFIDAYVAWKDREGVVDFTDLLERSADAHRDLPCDVVIVDEAQDLSQLQWRAFWAFAKNAKRVYIAGDDDQAIYEWAGASPRSFLEQPGTTVVLPISHRCPAVVTTLAKAIASRITYRQAKDWRPRSENGTLTRLQHLESWRVPSDGSVLCLYRNHRHGLEIVRQLHADGVVYEKQPGQSSVDPEVAHAIITWERLRRHVTVDIEAFHNALARMSIKRVTMAQREKLRALTLDHLGQRQLIDGGLGAGLFQLPWYDALDRLAPQAIYLRRVLQVNGAAGLTAPPRVRLSTIHGAKGAQADHVLLLTELGAMAARNLDRDPDPERRVWYVGVTRAKTSLTLVGSANPVLNGGVAEIR